MNRKEIFRAIETERDRQNQKWGVIQENTLAEWMTILGEEYGESCQQALRVRFGNCDPKDLLEEIIQVCAVGVSILEHETVWKDLNGKKQPLENRVQELTFEDLGVTLD